MVKTKDELLTALKEKIGDSTDDKDLTLLEDITDTIDDLTAKNKDTTNWEQKYKENDAAWRNKYKERFFSSDSDEDKSLDNDDKDDNPAPLTYADLFKPKD